MDQPVNIRIEFPRSGQQLRVTVPHNIAQAIKHTKYEGSVAWVDYIESSRPQSNGNATQ